MSRFKNPVLSILIAAVAICVTCTQQLGAGNPQHVPECTYVPEPPENPPENPFTMDGDDDGLTEQERLDFIRRGVAATIHVSTRRYTLEKGITFYSGSGVFIDRSHALTAEHVVHETADVYAGLRRLVRGGLSIGYIRWERIDVLRADQERDVALLRVYGPQKNAHPLPIARDWTPQKGELLWQFGNRTGWSRGRVVRQISDSSPFANRGMVQMRQLGQCGDSGGPVVNISGELVGLVLRGNSKCGRQFFVPIDVALRSVGRGREPVVNTSIRLVELARCDNLSCGR